MPKNSLSSLLGHIGNKRSRNEVLQVMSFPGLSVDNVSSVPTQLSGLSSATSGAGVDAQVSGLAQQLGDLKTAQQNQLDKLVENTQALTQNTSSRSSGTGSGTSGTGIASTILSATGLSPIITGLLGLFGGGSNRQQTLPPLTPFSLPPSIQYAAGVQSNGAVTPVDYGQNGQLRALPASTAQSAPTTVHVNVNALDSQSFLDHSEDIAQAVRQALLNSSTLRDVIADL